MSERRQLRPRGPFSLRAAAGFGFGPTEGRPPEFDGAMRLAFGLDGGAGYAGVVLRQPRGEPDGPVTVELALRDGADADTALTQTARIVSLDHDGEAFLEVGRRDRAIGRLQAAHPGERPVLFHSPYEAAAWSIISARRPAGVAARWRTEIAERFGERFELDGATLAAFPQPDRLAGLPDDIGGIGPEKAERLRALAATALTGALDAAHLQDLGPPDAYAEVQRLKGIGPFYATLIVLRATGFADAPLPVNEPRVLTHAARLYGLAAPPSAEALSELAEAWTPFRTWTLVLIRMAGERGTF